MSDIATQTADILLRARTEDRPIPDLPAPLTPVTLDDAYAVQEAVLNRLGGHGGWKVGPDNGSGRRCSALPRTGFHPSGAHLKAPAAGFEVEVETAFTFARDVTPGMAVQDAIGSVRIALEMVVSRFTDRTKVAPITAVADFQSNAAVILGPEVTDWRGIDLSALVASLSYDGVAQDAPQTHEGMAGALDSITWLATHAQARGRPLRAGDSVITGARIGPVPIGPASRVEAVIPELGRVTLHVEG